MLSLRLSQAAGLGDLENREWEWADWLISKKKEGELEPRL
jgi:hypothetical protein